MSGRVEIEIRNLEAVQRRLAGAADALQAGEARAVERGALLVSQRLRERTNRQDPVSRFSSRERRASFQRRIAQGAASDEFLRVRTGTLRRSIGATRAARVGNGYEARAGLREASVPYAPVHEFGTTRAGRSRNVTILARAPVRRSLEDRRVQIREAIDREIAAALRRAQGELQA